MSSEKLARRLSGCSTRGLVKRGSCRCPTDAKALVEAGFRREGITWAKLAMFDRRAKAIRDLEPERQRPLIEILYIPMHVISYERHDICVQFFLLRDHASAAAAQIDL
jgi:hypothetical protein